MSTATDPDDGTLPASAFSWTVLFHHDGHTHPVLGPLNGVTSGSFTIPQTGRTEDTVFYRVYLTVTDASGLPGITTRDVIPRKAVVTLNSNVPGSWVLLDGQPQTTPYSFTGVAGVQRSIEVPSPQSVGVQCFTFVSWPDGGARSHVITTPSTDVTYAATLAGEPPGAFAKPSPAAGATSVSTSPTLSWGTSTGATGYEYCYDTTSEW